MRKQLHDTVEEDDVSTIKRVSPQESSSPESSASQDMRQIADKYKKQIKDALQGFLPAAN